MIHRIVIHCSASPPKLSTDAATIDAWHREAKFEPRKAAANGLWHIGYNYVGMVDGSVQLGRDEGERLQHARGYQDDSIAYCLIGGVDENGTTKTNFTAEQFLSLRAFCDWMALKYPGAEIIGHRDLPGVMKDCPCFDVSHWRATGNAINPRKFA